MRPLDGVRVLDLTRVVSGPYCTMLLGDLGAEVIKIERPGVGDDTRAFGPPFQGGEAAYFLSINRNKKSVTLDLKQPGAIEVMWRLIDRSDVLVENFRPGTMDRLGFGYDTVARRRPKMIYCSISGFGDTGPERDRAGYDVIIQGEAGIMDLTGDKGGPPQKVGTSIADLVSGLTASQGILAALLAQRQTGKGEQVRVSMYEAVAAMLTFNASIYFATGISPTRRGNAHATIVPYETFQSADGWLNLGVANDDLWQRFCRAAGEPDLGRDPRFLKAPDRVRHRDDLVPLVAAIMKRHPRDAWLEMLDEAGVPCGAIRDVGEVCDGATLALRGMIAEMAHPTAGVVKGVKNPVGLSQTPLDTYIAPPALGQHIHEILGGLLGYNADEIRTLKDAGAI